MIKTLLKVGAMQLLIAFLIPAQHDFSLKTSFLSMNKISTEDSLRHSQINFYHRTCRHSSKCSLLLSTLEAPKN